MASTVANLLTSMVGNVVKPQPIIPIGGGDDGFARMLDAAANTPARPEQPATQQTAPSDSAPASSDAAPAADEKPTETTETAKAGETTETKSDDDKDTGTGENSLAESLLAALAALGLSTEQVGQAAAINDPAALGEVEGALNDLAKQLGMDLKTLMQQLAELAKGVAAAGGGKDDLAAKLKAFVSDKLGAAGVALDPGIEESFAKLLGGLEKLAKAIPKEPELATPELKLTEPVLTGKATATAAEEKPAVAAADLEAKPERKTEAKPADAAPAAQDKPPNATQSTRQNAPQDNNSAVSVAGPAQAAQPQNDPSGQPVSAATTPRVVQTGYQTSQQQLNLPQIAFELSRQVEGGNTRFQMRLDPAELGRIDVRLDIDHKGQVHAKLTVEKAETLDLMQRDQRALEKALQQAGLDQSKTNLEFSLKQNPFAGDQNQHSGSEQGGFGGGQDGQEETEVAAPPITLYRGALQASGVNIIA